ncbi:MAG: T9SS type A sorting domain-containing protein [Chlorobi bacterium]|nr:T9SS type A sorting domain-containing protein [Chlorobiota bacterium]
MKTKQLLAVVIFVFGSLYLSGQGQYGLGFDGLDDYVNCGNDASLDITGNITIEAWVYSTAINQNNWNRIVEKDWATSYYLGSGDGASTNAIAFGMDPNANQNNVVQTSDNVLNLNVWHHVAGTWDGSTLTIYVDGVLAASMPWVNPADGSTNNTLIGAYYGAEPHFFDGSLDEVRIWDVSLTQAQIRENMYKELDNPALEANLVAYYSFNEGSGQTSADLSSNSNTAVLGGTVAIEPSDPIWVTSTAPIPYYTVADGAWTTVTTWANGQYPPYNAWSRVEINNAVTIGVSGAIGEAVINPVGSVTINAGNLVTVGGSFIIRSNAGGSGSFINNGTFSYGSATVERYYAGSEWHLISSPISDAVSGMFTGLYLQYHDESDNLYHDITPTNVPLDPGTGYALWNNSSSTAEFIGTLNTGTIGAPNTVQRTATGGNSGWNLVGNPFCSAIDWDAATGWTKTNIDNATYRHVNSATWATYVGGVGTNGGTRYIAMGQGFFVSVSDPGSGGPFPVMGTLQSTEAVKVHLNTTAFYKDGISDFVRLEVSGNGYTDETVIRLLEGTTVGFDGDWDAHKIFGYVDEVGQIYTNQDQPLSINALPFGTESVPLGVKAGENSLFAISVTESSDIDIILLEDTETGTFTNLKNNSYNFGYVVGENDDRFILHLNSLTDIPDNKASGVNIFAYGNEIHLEAPYGIDGKIKVYNITGQLISQKQINGKSETIKIAGTGTFIVKVVYSNSVVTEKVTINK